MSRWLYGGVFGEIFAPINVVSRCRLSKNLVHEYLEFKLEAMMNLLLQINMVQIIHGYMRR